MSQTVCPKLTNPLPDFSQPTNNNTHTRKIATDNTPFLNSSTNPANLPNDPTTANTAPTKRLIWTLNFYSQFFDIDSTTVLSRCKHALLPFLSSHSRFLDTLDGNPDLYGPIWIATTVVVILFLTGTISQRLSRDAPENKAYNYDFRLLSGAAGLIYGYTLIIPFLLWAALRWFGASTLHPVESWSLYGYANLFWILVALCSWSPLNILNYVLVAAGFGVSCLFLVRNLWPVIQATDAKVSRILLGVVVVLHAALAVAIKVLFFSHGSPAARDRDGTGRGEDR